MTTTTTGSYNSWLDITMLCGGGWKMKLVKSSRPNVSLESFLLSSEPFAGKSVQGPKNIMICSICLVYCLCTLRPLRPLSSNFNSHRIRSMSYAKLSNCPGHYGLKSTLKMSLKIWYKARLVNLPFLFCFLVANSNALAKLQGSALPIGSEENKFVTDCP